LQIRYCKYSRDVSQSLWHLKSIANGFPEGENGNNGDDRPTERDDEDEEESKRARCSVEEIVCSAVTEHFKSKSCFIHACGREDIDVRMLGINNCFMLL
jgi:tRNA U54 and U55 pseudouridine synthase Pus10